MTLEFHELPSCAPHSAALVPLTTSAFHGPDLHRRSRTADMGLLAEALVYYDVVYLNVPTTSAFVEFVRWFEESHQLVFLKHLLDDGVLRPLHYRFMTLPSFSNGKFSIKNFQNPPDAFKSEFIEWFLAMPDIQDGLEHVADKAGLLDLVGRAGIDARVADFQDVVPEALRDAQDMGRCSLLVQRLANELVELGAMPRRDEPLSVRKEETTPGSWRMHWNFDFSDFAVALGKDFGMNDILGAAATCNRALVAARSLGADIVLGPPMSMLAGDKMVEVAERGDRLPDIVDQLVCDVEFPDVRTLVNRGDLTARDVLGIREESNRFRQWLQGVAERDIDAIVAYHNEVADKTGLQKFGGHALGLFGAVAGTKVGTLVAAATGSPEAGTAAGVATKTMFDSGRRFFEPWRPIVFGKWVRREIDALIRRRRAEGS